MTCLGAAVTNIFHRSLSFGGGPPGAAARIVCCLAHGRTLCNACDELEFAGHATSMSRQQHQPCPSSSPALLMSWLDRRGRVVGGSGLEGGVGLGGCIVFNLAFSSFQSKADFLYSPPLSCRTIDIVFTAMPGRLTFVFFSLLA